MNTTPSTARLTSDIQQVIESLAGYLCAMDEPEIALKSALAVLYSQIHQTNRCATEHLAAFQNRRAEVLA